ncbi:IPT/TIG domain-containing protein [Fimbriiglobus ruber]|uniref:Polymorphic outer membrane protein n=1 Tax=Fimbriiglobus ruber TaxID=1908690 RepID=A0A225DEL8_9BACT|nr:IPT/TIG domain-containing protein [Fimbriiglobus ruber]OWK39902.1 polymorphic outer membrane protein [Fimbriiglobus ruber]
MANTGDGTVSRITPAGVVTTFATGFTVPSGLAFDAAGNLYVADSTANTVSRVTPAGIVSTYASGFSAPVGLVFDAAGDLYVVNDGLGNVSEVTPAGVVTTFASGFAGADGLTSDAAGNLYVSNYVTGTVNAVSPAGVVTTYATGFSGPVGLAFDAAGRLYVANYKAGTLSMATAVTATVPFTLGGTAVAGTDYSGVTASPLVFAPGQTTADIAGTLAPGSGGQTLTVTLGTPTNATLGATTTNTLMVLPPTPAVTGLSPSSGPTTGGTTVTITGTSLGNATAVAFGGVVGAIVSDTPTQIVATAPTGTVGTVDATVTTAGGTTITSAADQFTYFALPASPPPASLPPASPPPTSQAVSAPAGGTAPVSLTATGADTGGAPIVWVYNADGSPRFSIMAYDPTFTGGVRVAVGDVNGDGIPDIITVPGPGGGPIVKVFSGVDGTLLQTFAALDGKFTGGLYVAAGDFNGDGHADIVTSADIGGGPRVTVYNGSDDSVMADFFGIADPNFRGGARVAVGDINYDGVPDLIVAAGFGGGPRVTIYDGREIAAAGGGTPAGTALANFFAFEQTLRNGVYVGSGDLTDGGFADLVFGAGPGGAPRVRVIDGQQLLAASNFSDLDTAVAANPAMQVANFFAGDPSSRVGVRVGIADGSSGTADILTSPGTGGGSAVSMYNAAGTVVGTENPFPGFTGGSFVDGSEDPTQALFARGTSAPLGQLVIRGQFVTGVPTEVVFADNEGYRVVVQPAIVTTTRVSVGVPVYVNPSTGQVGASGPDLTVSVIQTFNGGQVVTASIPYQITAPTPVAGTPGTLTTAYLTALQNLADNAIQGVQRVGAATPGAGGTAISGLTQQLAAVKQTLATLASQIQQLMSGQIASIPLGTVNGAQIVLTVAELALLDALIGNLLQSAGFDIGGDPNQILTNLIAWLENGQTKTDGTAGGWSPLPLITAGPALGGGINVSKNGAEGAAAIVDNASVPIGDAADAANSVAGSGLDPDFFKNLTLDNDPEVGQDTPHIPPPDSISTPPLSPDETPDPNDPSSENDNDPNIEAQDESEGDTTAEENPEDEMTGEAPDQVDDQNPGDELGADLGTDSNAIQQNQTVGNTVLEENDSPPASPPVSLPPSPPSPPTVPQIQGTYTGSYSGVWETAIPVGQNVSGSIAVTISQISSPDTNGHTAISGNISITGLPNEAPASYAASGYYNAQDNTLIFDSLSGDSILGEQILNGFYENTTLVNGQIHGSFAETSPNGDSLMINTDSTAIPYAVTLNKSN